MRKTWTLFFDFINKRINAIDKICDNVDRALIDGTAALADVASDLKVKELV